MSIYDEIMAEANRFYEDTGDMPARVTMPLATLNCHRAELGLESVWLKLPSPQGDTVGFVYSIPLWVVNDEDFHSTGNCRFTLDAAHDLVLEAESAPILPR